MNTLTYKLLVDKTIKRRVNILTLLLESSHPIPLKNISHICDVSLKTIQYDLAFLTEAIPQSIEVVEYNHTPSLTRIGSTKSITEYITTLMEDNPLFFILDSIFFGKKLDALSYSLELYLSESTIIKYLEILRGVLSEYNLSLSTPIIDIAGPEENIRIFFFHYFRYIHESRSPIYSQEQYNFIFNTFRTLREKYGLVLNADYYRTASWLYIFENRVKSGKHIHLSEDLKEKYREAPSYIRFRNAVLEHFTDSEMSKLLTEDELFYIYFVRLDLVIYESNNSFLTDDFIGKYSEFENLILEFMNINNLNVSLNLQLKGTLQAYLANLSVLSELTPLFEKCPSYLVKVAQTKFRKTLMSWETLIRTNTTFQFPDDVAANLTLLSQTKKVAKKRVLFVLTGEPSSVSYYKMLALQCVPKNSEAFFLFNTPLSNDLLAHMQIDWCVLNFEPRIDLNSAKLYQLSDIPLEVEWRELAEILHKI